MLTLLGLLSTHRLGILPCFCVHRCQNQMQLGEVQFLHHEGAPLTQVLNSWVLPTADLTMMANEPCFQHVSCVRVYRRCRSSLVCRPIINIPRWCDVSLYLQYTLTKYCASKVRWSIFSPLRNWCCRQQSTLTDCIIPPQPVFKSLCTIRYFGNLLPLVA